VSPADAEALGLGTGDKAKLVTRRGEAVVVLEVTGTLRAGHITLPNGLGLAYPAGDGPTSAGSDVIVTGVAPNELTSAGDRDRVAGTPWHKHVRARLERLAS